MNHVEEFRGYAERAKNLPMNPLKLTRRPGLFRCLCWFQGIYYLATGLWPIFSIRTFQAVTGRKFDNLPSGREADHWLVMTVAVLIVATAIPLLIAAWRKTQALEIAALAIGAAIGLTAVGVIYTSRRVIAPIYLADTAVEVPLIILWGIGLASREPPREV